MALRCTPSGDSPTGGRTWLACNPAARAPPQSADSAVQLPTTFQEHEPEQRVSDGRFILQKDEVKQNNKICAITKRVHESYIALTLEFGDCLHVGGGSGWGDTADLVPAK